MESIRILQNTYEDLYVLAKPIRNFLQERLPLAFPNSWRRKVDEILEKQDYDEEKSYAYKKSQSKLPEFENLDLYHLLKILLYSEVWNSLKDIFIDECNFFTNENKDLLQTIKEIRNNISHPSPTFYTIDDYREWVSEIKSAARLFKTELSILKSELYAYEKEKLLKIIFEKVINPALASKNIKESTRKSVENTKKRLEMQDSAQGIIFFFEDSLNSLRGKEIVEDFHNNNLLAFEDIKDKVLNAYYE